jgi:hypothetical protein
MSRHCGSPQLLHSECTTSARRFLSNGIYWHSLRNQLLKLAYTIGLPTSLLNLAYERREQINVKYDTPSPKSGECVQILAVYERACTQNNSPL